VQTDRGQAFFAHEVQDRLRDRRVKFRPNRPRAPHLNGKVERVQRTALEEFWPTVNPKDPTLATRLEGWRTFSNHHRPHGALGGGTPAERIAELAPKIPTREAVRAAYDPSREPRTPATAGSEPTRVSPDQHRPYIEAARECKVGGRGEPVGGVRRGECEPIGGCDRNVAVLEPVCPVPCQDIGGEPFSVLGGEIPDRQRRSLGVAVGLAPAILRCPLLSFLRSLASDVFERVHAAPRRPVRNPLATVREASPRGSPAAAAAPTRPCSDDRGPHTPAPAWRVRQPRSVVVDPARSSRGSLRS
jgi:hypothetical protein